MYKNGYSDKNPLTKSSVRGNAFPIYQSLFALILCLSLAHTSMAQISGVVYRDFNEDGVRSFTAATPFFGEIGVGNITVNVYNATGLVGSTTTSSTTGIAGSYSISPTGAGPYRVEFVGLPAGAFDGSKGTTSGTSVQFVATSPASNINLGINFPYDYCQTDPDFIVPCYVNGNSLGNGSAADRGVLIVLPYSSTGNSPAESPIALNNQVGTVYGVAYHRIARTVFTAAFVKRHTGLGVGGAGAIYVTRPDQGTTSLFTTLPTAVSAITSPSLSGTTVVGSNTDRGLPDEPTTQNHDPNTFDQVGKAGLGDIEISEDGTQLYAVNLGDRLLYRIPVINANTLNPSAGTPTTFALPDVTQTAGSVFRPFALKYYRGLVYVGGVTTNEGVTTTTNSGLGSTGGNTPLITRDTTGMKAVVFSFDPATSTFTQVLTFPLTYQKGGVNNDQTGVSRADRWFPWTGVEPGVGTVPNRYARNDGANTSYPQAILAGIEFDVEGSMILSIRDRFGDQYGNNNIVVDVNSTKDIRAIAPGDILRAGKCDPAVDQWTLEYNAQTCTSGPTLGAGTFQGPGGGEYYYGDAIQPGGPFHLEMSEGGLALLPGRDEVASIVLDPTDQIDAGGIRRFKNSDGSGSPANSVQIYRSGGVATFGKANGLGDLEISCDLPPIQIGNRVWRDLNNDGVQDPGEPGLAGVTVALLGPGSTTLATAVTDANGEYYFSTDSGTSTISSIFNLTLTPGGSYALSFPTSFSAFNISPSANAGTGPNANAIDSDPTTAGVISFTLGQVGQNNFTYDAGYICAPLALTLTSVTICAGQTVSLTATAGFSSYSFSSGLTQVGITNVASGTANGAYTVTAINSAGCSGTATGTITLNPLPVVTLTSATVCAGQTASLTATPGFVTYIFPAGLTQVGNSNVATGTVGGTYSVTAISNAGCIGVASGAGLGTITINNNPVVSLSSATVCAGQTATLTATAGFATYQFSTGLTQVNGSNVATGIANGTYSVTATTSAGCSGTAQGSITVNPLPVVTLSSATICAGQTGTLTATPGFASYQFSAGLTPVPGQPNVATGTVTSLYSVTAISADGCAGVASGNLTVNPVPVVSLSSATICAGQTATLTATSGYATYIFSTGLTQSGNSNAATGTTAGAYSVTAISSAGCSATATGSIIVNPNPVITLSSATICADQTASLTVTPGFTTYQFSAGLTPVAGQPNVATGTVGGTYSVTASTAEGCTGVTSGSITVNPLPVVALSSATICVGQTASLTATAGYSTYIFSTGLTQSGTSNAATGTVAGPYSVTAISSAGCLATATGTITVNPNPVIRLSSVTVCDGQTALLTATPGLVSYQFSAGLTPTSDANSASGTVGGSYSVTAIDDNGCSATAVGSITVNPLPVVTLSSATICAGQTASLTATPGFALYLFPSTLGLTPGQSNVATGTAAGTYSVTVVSAAGCLGIATGTITVNPTPQLALSSATVCVGQTASLTATPGYDTYIFSSSLTQVGTSNVAVGTAEGTYSVTAINSLGCSATAAGSISNNPLPVVSLSSTTICAGQTASLTATPSYTTYIFSPGLTQVGNSNVATGSVDGAYSVTAINSNGCSGTATGTIVISPDVVVTLSSATICSGQIGVLTATPGYDTYIFSPGLAQVGTSNVASSTVTGTYSVTALNSIGCSASATGSVSVHPIAIVSLASATVCTGQSATLVATPGFADYQFSAGLTPIIGQPNVATGIVADTYSVTATSSSTCSGSATGSITINPLPTAAINVSSATICEGQSTTLTASGGDTYVWSTGEQTASIVVTTGGLYSVTATTLGGCSDVASTTITVNLNPVLTINSPTVCSGQSATLTVEGCTGGTVTWSTGATTASILVSPTATTSYSAICTLATGCSSTTSTSVTVNNIPSFTAAPQAITASCSGATVNNDARILLTTLQNTERADIVVGASYGTGPAYNAPTNVTVTAGTVSFTNLPNPATSQSYTIRLFNPGGNCYTDVTVILQPSVCTCPPEKCIPVVIQRIAGRIR